MPLDPQTEIDSRFRITTRLGGNSHGSTAKAKRLADDSVVVLKHCTTPPGTEIDTLIAQVRSIQKLTDSCDELLSIDEVFVHEQQVFQLLPFFSLRSLKRHRCPARVVPAKPTKTTGAAEPIYSTEDFAWLARVGNALDFLAAQGRVHGDVKPTNILFSEDKRGKLTSYLSDVEVFCPPTGGLKDNRKDEYPGTLQYVSQEVFMDRDAISPKSDQYALAVTLYQWLAGELPFEGTTGIAMYKAFKAGCQPIQQRCPDLPETAAAAIHRALSVELEDRFDSSGEFATAFMAELPSQKRKRFALKQALVWVPAVAAILVAGFVLARANSNRTSTVAKPPAGSDTEVLAVNPSPGDPLAVNVPQSDNSKPGQVVKVGPSNSLPGVVNKDNARTYELKKNRTGETSADLTKDNSMKHPNPVAAHPGWNQKKENTESVLEKNNGYQSPSPVERSVRPSAVVSKPLLVEPAKRQPGDVRLSEEERDFQWTVKQASQPNSDATTKFKLAQMYDEGVGVKADTTEAVNWYRKAAQQGLPDAQVEMGRRYEARAEEMQKYRSGYGEYLQRAYQWYEKAALQNRPDISDHLVEFCAKHNRKDLAIQWREKAQDQRDKQRLQEAQPAWQPPTGPQATQQSPEQTQQRNRRYPNDYQPPIAPKKQ